MKKIKKKVDLTEMLTREIKKKKKKKEDTFSTIILSES